MSERHAVVLFHTTNHALRAEKVLRRASVDCRLVPVPRHLSSDCGMCVRVAAAEGERAAAELAAARVETAGLHMLS